MTDAHELAIERTIDAPIDVVWRAFAEHLAEWWAPRPWTTRVIRHELRAGGATELDMRGPDGAGGPMRGIFLDVVPGRRVVFTNAIDADAHPQSPQPVSIVGIFEFADAGDGGTRYRAAARHWTREAMEAHAAMGFDEGWGRCADQLAEVARRLSGKADA